jgi:hypothetical protein
MTASSAGCLVDQLAGDGLLDEITGRKRNRVFRYTPYWRLFQDENEGRSPSLVFVQTATSGALTFAGFGEERGRCQ